jgi:multidrug efflux pump subunit AcrB
MLILSLGLIVGGGYYAGKLQFSVFPAPKDTDQINISILYPPGTDLATAEDTAKAVESILVDQAEDYVEAVTYFIANRTEAYLAVDLTPMEERDLTSGEIVAELQSLFADYGETRIRVAQASVGPPAEEYPYTMQVYADSPETLRTATEDIRRFIAGVTLSDDIEITDTLVQNLDTVAKIDGRRYAVVRAKISDETNTGAIIEIRDQVEAEYTETRLTALGLDPDALGFDFGQESENISSFSSTIFALLVALIAMYALLVVQYNSFLQPFLIFLAIPFSFPGLFPGLFLTDNALSFFVMVGILSLVGITVNNTIMLTDFANREHEENPNKRLRENIAQALRIRFRPILATSATTVAGLLPLALSDPFWESLAYTIIFGLISSTLMVLLFFPVYYWLVERLRKALHRVIPGFGLKDLDRQPQA